MVESNMQFFGVLTGIVSPNEERLLEENKIATMTRLFR